MQLRRTFRKKRENAVQGKRRRISSPTEHSLHGFRIVIPSFHTHFISSLHASLTPSLISLSLCSPPSLHQTLYCTLTCIISFHPSQTWFCPNLYLDFSPIAPLPVSTLGLLFHSGINLSPPQRPRSYSGPQYEVTILSFCIKPPFLNIVFCT